MLRSHTYYHGFPRPPASRLGSWGGAVLVHGGVVLALLLGWPQAREILVQASPIEVQLLPTQPPPPEPARPLPVRAPRMPPAIPSQVAAPVPPPDVPVPLTSPLPPSAIAEPVVTSAPAALLTSNGPTAATLSVAPAPAVVAPSSAPMEAPLVEASFHANYLSNPSPNYPLASRRRGETGVVRLHVLVGTEGQALKVEIKSGSGYPRLDQSALDTVAHWRFVPARRGADKMVSWVLVPIVFSLN